MRHKSTLLTAAMVVFAMAVAPLGAAAVSTQPAAAEGTQVSMVAQDNETAANESLSPGERLSGVVGVQEAEVSGAIEQREFGIRMAKAASNDSKAAVINQTTEQLQERLRELAEKKARLKQARQNGSMSQGQFAARMAKVQAQSKAISQLANATENRSKGLPADVLRKHGVNVTAIQQLQENAKNLTGPETAAIARTIAGPNVGNVTNVTRGPPENVTTGPDNQTGDASQAIQRAAAAVERAQANVEKAEQRVTNDSGDAADALETAKAKLELAKSKLAEARAAAEDGDSAEAARLAKQATQHANTSLDAARTAIQQAGGGTTTDGTTTSGGTSNGTTTTTTQG